MAVEEQAELTELERQADASDGKSSDAAEQRDAEELTETESEAERNGGEEEADDDDDDDDDDNAEPQSGSDSDGGADDEEDDGGEDTLDAVGFGDAMSKILQQNVAEDAQPILAKRTTARMREIQSDKQQTKTARLSAAEKRLKEQKDMVIPGHTTAPQDRQLRMIATKGGTFCVEPLRWDCTCKLWLTRCDYHSGGAVQRDPEAPAPVGSCQGREEHQERYVLFLETSMSR